MLTKRILITINGDDLAARAWRASRPTSSYRKDEGGKVIFGKGQHIVPELWESARCANISLKTDLRGNIHDGLIKDHWPG